MYFLTFIKQIKIRYIYFNQKNQNYIMGNARTVIPGMQNSDNDSTRLNTGGDRTNIGTADNGRYYGNNNSSGTRVPGTSESYYQGNNIEQMIQKPIVGFLVSVSRTDEGEYWIIRQGQNRIGSGDSNEIKLAESLVSDNHAVIAVHRNPGDGNRLNVGIIDKGSSNGTFVNGNYIGFTACQVKNMDKIQIGNYDMLLLLFDAVDYGMIKSDKFQKKSELGYDERDMYSENDGTRF